jgi:hypothetical protein
VGGKGEFGAGHLHKAAPRRPDTADAFRCQPG